MQLESEQVNVSEGPADYQHLRDDFEDRQTYQLRLQVLAYKYLVRNMSIPAHIERALLQITKEQWEIEREIMFNNSVNYYQSKIEKNEELKSLIRERIQRRSSDQQIEQGRQMGEQQNQKVILSYFQEKNTHFVEKRRNEISQLLAKSDLSTDVRQQLRMEQLFLSQKDFYLRVRDKVLGVVLQEENVQSLQGRLLERQMLDRNYFRRDRPQRRIESRLSDKFELNMIRHEQDRRKRQKIKEFMSAVFAHQLEFFEFHRKKYKHARKRGTGVRAYIEQMEKKRQEVNGKKQRLKFLKENKIEDYVDLIQEMKNERILEILRQTDEFLRTIGAKVKVQKGDNKDEGFEDEENVGQSLALNLKHSNRVYYNITHRIKEDVKTQPSLLEGGELKSYQIQGLEWLVSLYNNSLNGILADEMGLGKTIQTISLICYLMENKKNFGPFLIIVPLSTLSNWCLEFDKWAPSINKLQYKGSPQARKDLAKIMKTTKWNICLTTYEYILKDRLTLSKFEWKYIIIDEGHRMKNSRSKFAYVLGQQYQSDRRLLLTGTPLQNNLSELWALLNFLLPKVFSSCDDFEKWFAMPLSRMGGNDREVGLNEEEQLLIINRLHQVLRPFLLRRVKKEVESELPNKVEFVIKVELSAWQKHIYEQIESRGLMTFDQQTGKTGTRALQNLMMQLRKICNHPYLFLLNLDLSNPSDEVWRSSGKFELLDRMLHKLLVTGHRMLIFSQMTQLLDIMEVFMEYRGMRYLRLDGSTKAEDRPTRINLFCSENSPFNIFLLSTRAGGLGLNLQAADTVILFDSDWNPHMDLQAQDRAYRIGQKNEVRVYRLVTATMVEEAILNKAEFKMGLDQMIIQAGLFNQKSTDSERKERLKDFFKQKNRFEEFEAEEIPNDEQLNEWLARSEDEFDLFQLMDQQRYEEEKEQFKHYKDVVRNSNKGINYRLIQEDEVPSWIRQTHHEPEVEKEYGRGNRIRKQVVYTEELTDQQFMRMLDEGIDPVTQQNNNSQKNDQDKVFEFKLKMMEEEDPVEQSIEDNNFRKIKKIKINVNSDQSDVEESGNIEKNDYMGQKRSRKFKKIEKDIVYEN